MHTPTLDNPHARLLPHEWLFGGWLLTMSLWLMIVTGRIPTSSLLFTGSALLSGALVWWCARKPGAAQWRVRLLWYPALMGICYYALPASIALLRRPMADASLTTADNALLGQPAAQLLQTVASPAMTDLLTMAYLFFFVMLVFGPGHYCLRDLPRFRSCIVGLFCLYALGFSGYVGLPAAGPHQFLALPPLPAGPLTQWMAPVIGHASNGVDVFPSIHFAASFYLLAFDARFHRSRFWCWLLPTLLLWLSTVYLRYHYLVDLIVGLAVAAASLIIALGFERSTLQKQLTEPFIAPPGTRG